MIPQKWKIPILQQTPIIKKSKYQFVVIGLIEMIPLHYCHSQEQTQSEPSSCTMFAITTVNLAQCSFK